MSTQQLHLQIKVAWWLWPYLNTLAFVCAVMGSEPDWDKLTSVINAAISIEVSAT